MVPEVRERHRPKGSGGIYTVRGKSLPEVEQRARERAQAIDSMRSPAMGLPRKDAATGDHIVEVRYYGV